MQTTVHEALRANELKSSTSENLSADVLKKLQQKASRQVRQEWSAAREVLDEMGKAAYDLEERKSDRRDDFKGLNIIWKNYQACKKSSATPELKYLMSGRIDGIIRGIYEKIPEEYAHFRSVDESGNPRNACEAVKRYHKLRVEKSVDGIQRLQNKFVEQINELNASLGEDFSEAVTIFNNSADKIPKTADAITHVAQLSTVFDTLKAAVFSNIEGTRNYQQILKKLVDDERRKAPAPRPSDPIPAHLPQTVDIEAIVTESLRSCVSLMAKEGVGLKDELQFLRAKPIELVQKCADKLVASSGYNRDILGLILEDLKVVSPETTDREKKSVDLGVLEGLAEQLPAEAVLKAYYVLSCALSDERVAAMILLENPKLVVELQNPNFTKGYLRFLSQESSKEGLYRLAAKGPGNLRDIHSLDTLREKLNPRS